MKHIVLCFFLLMLCCSSLVADPITSPRNVVWIVLDACRAESLGAYGYVRDTSPFLDRLAEEGACFNNHFSQASKTYQSVPSYMTGRYFPQPCFSKRFSQTIFERAPADDEKMFGEILQLNGYASAMFTNMPLFRKDDRLARSFDEAFIWTQGEKILLQRWVVMTEKINGWLEAHQHKPFFLYIHAADTHFPHEMILPYDQWMDPNFDTSPLRAGGYGQNYSRLDDQPFTSEDREWLRGYYDGMIRDANDRVEELLHKLDELKLLDNTLVLITADHGQLIGEDGFTVAHTGDTDQNIHVPLILRGPDIPAGIRIDALTEHVDLVPTLVDYLALQSDASFDGKSMMPLLQGNMPADWRDHVFTIPNRDNYETPQGFSLQSRQLKYCFDSGGTLTAIYKTPDRAENRIDLTLTHRLHAEQQEQKLKSFFLPRLRSMQQASVQRIVLEGAWIANFGTPSEAVEDYYISGESSRKDLEKDHKWAYTDGFLWAMHASEKVPPLSYSTSAPDGVYNAVAYLWNSLSFQGKPASALSLRFRNDSEPRQTACTSLPDDKAALLPLPLGQVAITDGQLSVTLLPSELPWWTRLFSIELLPLKIDSNESSQDVPSQPSPEEADELNEMIKSAGYM